MKMNSKNDAAAAIAEKILIPLFLALIIKTMLNASRSKNNAPKIKEKINLQLPPKYYPIIEYWAFSL